MAPLYNPAGLWVCQTWQLFTVLLPLHPEVGAGRVCTQYMDAWEVCRRGPRLGPMLVLVVGASGRQRRPASKLTLNTNTVSLAVPGAVAPLGRLPTAVLPWARRLFDAKTAKPQTGFDENEGDVSHRTSSITTRGRGIRYSISFDQSSIRPWRCLAPF